MWVKQERAKDKQNGNQKTSFWDTAFTVSCITVHAKEWMEEDNGKVDLQVFGIEEGATEKAVARSCTFMKIG